MKKLLLLISLIITSISGYAQIFCHNWALDFDLETSSCNNIRMDTISHSFNSWQIGPPQKTVFNAAHSPTHVIVTDTINTYPVNDTSVFEVVFTADLGYNFGHTVILSGYYNVDTDSLNDFGTMEVSPDNGVTWIDVVNPGIYASSMWWNTPVPVLTGSSNGWQNFAVNLPSLGPQFSVQIGDTIRYRFTFISDGIAETRDGLMFDDLHFEDWAEGIEEFSNGNLLASVNPNPATDHLAIDFKNPMNENFTLKVYDVLGNEVANISGTDSKTFQMDVSNWKEGMYFYRLSNTTGQKWNTGKFIVSY